MSVNDDMKVKRLSKRLSTLNLEQIAYVNGCQTLQRAVWRICHEDALFALRFQIKKFTLQQPLAPARQRLLRLPRCPRCRNPSGRCT